MAVAAATLALLAATGAAHAAAVTDGSVGAVQSLSGAMVVPQTLGAARGGNLFHSFARFGIAAGESATFTTVDPGLRHVIARVTGGEGSVLQGPLSLQAAGGARPDFWLVNPSGVLVGAGASFDLPAGLHLSTAPQLRFADGTVWATGSSAPSTLSVAAPESFGFLPGTPAAALRWQDANLALQAGSTLELVAGDMTIDRSLLVTTDGRLRVDATALALTGAASLSGGFLTQTSGTGDSGAIDVRVTGPLTMGQGGLVRAINFGPTAAAPLRIDGGSINLAGGAEVSSFALGAGPAADLRLVAESLRFDGAGTGLISRGFDGGAGGIRIEARSGLEVVGGAGILSVSSGGGLPGSVDILGGTLTVQGSGSSIVSLALGGTAPAANVRLQAGQRLVVAGGAEVASDTLAAGNGGTVQVTAPIIELGGDPAVASRIGSGSFVADSGHAGAVNVQAGRLTVGAGAEISSLTVSDRGDAADVTVRADAIVVDGGSGSAAIQSFAGSALGNAGNVRVESRGELTLREGGGISAGTTGFGRNGSITVSADALLIDGRRAVNRITGIGAGALGQGVAASAPVVIDARQVELRDGGVITTITNTAADAGAITLTADRLVLDGSNLNIPTAISSDSVGSGNAGRIDIRAREVSIANRSLISSTAQAGGRGGTIRVDTQGRLVVDGGAISTDAFGSGDAGSIDVHAGDVRITNVGFLTSSTSGTGRGGTVGITAQSLTVDTGGIIFSTTLAAGDAGRIDLDVTGAVTLIGGAKVGANTTGAGAGGLVNIAAGSLTISGRDAEGFRSGVSARALPGSSGRPGSLSIDVAGTFELRDGGFLSIGNEARVANPTTIAPPTLSVRAGDMVLSDASIIATSSENVNAGRIAVTTTGAMRLERSAISTSALDGDGGPITIAAGGPIFLKDSGISTSVTGTTNGNGGDIAISGPALVLASGFVLANTAAPQARGGNVTVDAGLLVPDGSNVIIGGSRIATLRSGLAGFNVIQAAAPDGVAGQLDLTRPELNLSGNLVTLLVPSIDFGLIGRDVCSAGTDSSFTVLGAGALPAAAAAPLRISPQPRR